MVESTFGKTDLGKQAFIDVEEVKMKEDNNKT